MGLPHADATPAYRAALAYLLAYLLALVRAEVPLHIERAITATAIVTARARRLEDSRRSWHWRGNKPIDISTRSNEGEPMTNRRLIGHVAVDTGTVVIADPTNEHVEDVFDKMIEHDDQTISLDGLVISSTGLGDGFYPVYIETAVLDDDPFGDIERVTKIIIDCELTDPQRKFLDTLEDT